ncbi:MAG: amidohydrolase family protein [Verrucomicrobia bacterium]|nr:amidohydrolase family protein [Verrucomicrobiota bacterium]MBU4292022.1 amidohydrolase family protein [Verrucomicrobiota bacterium]MBU4427910.1 amidohydrolase family protein [Verrucomicrobiota bacterium]MCG2678856.1 amidohydrolase family protein [Kiritimatiellia bacterium]
MTTSPQPSAQQSASGFIDIHGHAYRIPAMMPGGKSWFSTTEQLIRRYKNLGIEKACLLPLVSPEVYLPQSNEEILQITEQFPDRFIPFCNIDPRAISNSADAPLGDLLRYYRDLGCKGIGEVMPNLPFLDPLVQNLFHHVEEVGFPLIFDISHRIGGSYGLYDDPGLPQLEQCLQNFPKLIILGHGPAYWAEIGKLRAPEDRAGYPNYSFEEEGAVPRLFRNYPNMYGDLSAASGYNALTRNPAYASRFLNEFQDRLFFGTDICGPDQPVYHVEFLRHLRDTKQISETTFTKIARGNALKLLNLG